MPFDVSPKHLTSTQSIVQPAASQHLHTTSSPIAGVSALLGRARSASAARLFLPNTGTTGSTSIQPKKTLLRLLCKNFRERPAREEGAADRGELWDGEGECWFGLMERTRANCKE